MSPVILCTSSYDMSIKFWEATSTQCYHSLPIQESQVNHLAITHKAPLHLAAATNRDIKLFHLASHTQTPLVASFQGHRGNVLDILFDENDEIMVTCGEDETIKIWDVRRAKLLKEVKCESIVNSIALYPDQVILISAEEGGKVCVWNIENDIKKLCEVKLDSPVRSVSVSPAGDYVICGTNSGTVHVFQIMGEALEGAMLVAEELDEEDDDDSASITTSRSTGSGAVDIASHKPQLQQVHGQQNDRHSTSSTLSTGGSSGELSSHLHNPSHTITTQSSSSDSIVPNMDNITLQPVKQFQAHDRYILKVLISPDADIFATTSADRMVKIWSLNQDSPEDLFKNIQTLKGHKKWVWDCAFSSDSAYLVTASSDGTAKLWDVSKGEAIKTYKGHQKAVVSVFLHDQPPQ